jgi:hypothetical protein
MRELAWNTANNTSAREICERLKEILSSSDEAEGIPYTEVFKGDESGALRQDLLRFINEEKSLSLPTEFTKQFSSLLDLLDGKGPKRLRDAAQTNLFPRQNLLNETVNLYIIYLTGIIYCLARLTIIALLFSSLRAMPDSVYETTWANVIPNTQ